MHYIFAIPPIILLSSALANHFAPPATTTISPFSKIPFDFNFSIPASTTSSIESFFSTYIGVTFHAIANWLNVLLLSVIANIGHPAPNPAILLAESPVCV